MGTVDIECYLIVKAVLRGSGEQAYVFRSSARLSKKAPRLEPGEVPIHLTLALPCSLFQRPSLRATVTVPADKAAPAVIDATVSENIVEQIRAATGLNVTLVVQGPE